MSERHTPAAPTKSQALYLLAYFRSEAAAAARERNGRRPIHPLDFRDGLALAAQHAPEWDVPGVTYLDLLRRYYTEQMARLGSAGLLETIDLYTLGVLCSRAPDDEFMPVPLVDGQLEIPFDDPERDALPLAGVPIQRLPMPALQGARPETT